MAAAGTIYQAGRAGWLLTHPATVLTLTPPFNRLTPTDQSLARTSWSRGLLNCQVWRYKPPLTQSSTHSLDSGPGETQRHRAGTPPKPFTRTKPLLLFPSSTLPSASYSPKLTDVPRSCS